MRRRQEICRQARALATASLNPQGRGSRLVKMMRALWIASCCSLLLLSSSSGVEGIGVNYGMIANNLPSPDKVIALYRSRNITDVRLFHPNTTVLAALQGSGLGVVLGTLNEDLARLASDASFAASWVQSYVQPFAGAVRFRYVAAGNEVIPGDLAAFVLPAMRNLESALRAAGIVGVPVTTAVSTSVLGSSYPPSQGAFSEAALPTVGPIASFLASRSTPLLVNVYPYFAYVADPSSVQLDYALLEPASAAAVTDGGVAYTNMFDAIVDAVHAALDRVGQAEGGVVEVVVSETGWPSGGGGAGASVGNAAAYVNNVVRHVGSGRGTPRRPGKALEAFIFAMFNENEKPEGVEQHFGLFQPDMTEVYHVDFTAAGASS